MGRSEVAETWGSPLSGSVRWACALGGSALLVVGTVAVFVSENGVGAAAVTAAGSVLLLVAVLADRITALEAGGVKVQLEATKKLGEAEIAERAGDPELAAQLRGDALALISGNAERAERFSLTRQAPPGWRRTAELERQMRDWSRAAQAVPPSRSALEQVFDRGGEADRAMALAMMTGRPAAASHRVAMEAVETPASAFEQYHGLAVARVIAVQDPGSEETHRLADAIRRALESGRFGAADSDRVMLAKRVLDLTPWT
ncbi:hypothetical protein IC607_04910 [Cellulomonas sp. JH27-2]|uniref:hypothetical protein n=1 Tax=Cellulomonas sp. JH27-2 TaxID=2774139 RepID=UPI00177B9575|nr:hypothetical protein [Cellulomonas sp. JH27-2]MBD8058307.1 hypothetical protein [Cellulomonas sp. JH27-2]